MQTSLEFLREVLDLAEQAVGKAPNSAEGVQALFYIQLFRDGAYGTPSHLDNLQKMQDCFKACVTDTLRAGRLGGQYLEGILYGVGVAISEEDLE